MRSFGVGFKFKGEASIGLNLSIDQPYVVAGWLNIPQISEVLSLVYHGWR